MVGRDGAEARKERLQRIARFIQAALHKEGEIQLTKTVAVLQYDMGLTREKLQEYLEILRDLGQFVMDFEHDKIKKVIEEEPPGTNQ
jgi:protein-disulfide isomerase-like protein with CxxC motif